MLRAFHFSTYCVVSLWILNYHGLACIHVLSPAMAELGECRRLQIGERIRYNNIFSTDGVTMCF